MSIAETIRALEPRNASHYTHTKYGIDDLLALRDARDRGVRWVDIADALGYVGDQRANKASTLYAALKRRFPDA